MRVIRRPAVLAELAAHGRPRRHRPQRLLEVAAVAAPAHQLVRHLERR